VLLLTGFLGAGKTTALNGLLSDPPEPGARVAVVINEFGALNVDAGLLRPGAVRSYEINQGCLFCACTTSQLQAALSEIAEVVRPDFVLIEATGLAEPRDLESALESDRLASAFELRATVCLVDPLTFPKVATVLEASRVQVRQADLVLLNKCDLVDEAQIRAAEQRVREVRSDVPLQRTRFGRLPREALRPSPGGRKIPSAPAQREPPRGFVSVCYESDVPVDRRAFHELLAGWRTRCWRAKGQVLFTDGPLFVELAGGRVSSRPVPEGGPDARAPGTAFVLILEGQDPIDALAALRACERPPV